MRGDATVEGGHAFEMSYGVLRQALRPAADEGQSGWWQGAEDACQFFDRERREVFLGAAEESFCGCAAKEGAEEACSGGDAAGKLLIDKGAGEEVGAGAWRDEEAEAGCGRVRVCAAKAKATMIADGATGLHL